MFIWPPFLTLAYFFDHLYLPIEASRPALDQRHIGCQTHLVHLPSRIEIVQGIEYEVEPLEPIYIEPRVFDVRVMGFELDVRVEFCGRFFGNL